MSTSTPVGLALTSIAGMMSGNCMLPTKFVRTWKWENVWEIFSVVSLILLPWALALVLVRDLEEVDRMLTLAQNCSSSGTRRGMGNYPDSVWHLRKALRAARSVKSVTPCSPNCVAASGAACHIWRPRGRIGAAIPSWITSGVAITGS